MCGCDCPAACTLPDQTTTQAGCCPLLLQFAYLWARAVFTGGIDCNAGVVCAT